MEKTKKNKGITLIALVITIIILLILAGISIATLTGENGVLTKASKADKDTDIADTKEQIKLEIMGNFNEETANYTNKDVIDAVFKITRKTVNKGDPTVQSQKGNSVDISDLWIEEKKIIQFTVVAWDERVVLSGVEGDTWFSWFTREENRIQIQNLKDGDGKGFLLAVLDFNDMGQDYSNGVVVPRPWLPVTGLAEMHYKDDDSLVLFGDKIDELRECWIYFD